MSVTCWLGFSKSEKLELHEHEHDHDHEHAPREREPIRAGAGPQNPLIIEMGLILAMTIVEGLGTLTGCHRRRPAGGDVGDHARREYDI